MRTSLEKIYTSHFICKVLCVWEGAGDRTELQHIDPHSYGHRRCVFLVLQGCSTGGPGPLLPGGPFSTTSCLQLIWTPTCMISNSLGVPKAPSARWWLSLPHLASNVSGPKLSDLLSTPSYIIVQLPTQSLEWHVCSSLSGNNCHAVHRPLSSGASVYECIMGFLPWPIFQPDRLRDFFSKLPSDCVTSFRCITLEWHVCPGWRSIYNNNTKTFYVSFSFFVPYIVQEDPAL